MTKYDVMTLAEGAGSTQKTALALVDPDLKVLDMSYYFDGVSLGYMKRF